MDHPGFIYVDVLDETKCVSHPFFTTKNENTLENFSKALLSVLSQNFPESSTRTNVAVERVPNTSLVRVLNMNECSLWDWYVLTRKLSAHCPGSDTARGAAPQIRWAENSSRPGLLIPSKYREILKQSVSKPSTKKAVCCWVKHEDVFVKPEQLRTESTLHRLASRTDLGTWYRSESVSAPSFDVLREDLWPTFVDSHALFLKGGTGSCKTVTTIKFIKRYNDARMNRDHEPLKVLYFSNRIVFARNTAERINEIVSWDQHDENSRFVFAQPAGCYKGESVRKVVNENIFITQSLESLQNLYNCGTAKNPFSFQNVSRGRYILVVDEAPELLKTLVGPTVRHKRTTCCIFETLLQHAHKTVVLSDDLTATNVQTLVKLLPAKNRKSIITLQREVPHVRSKFCKSEVVAYRKIIQDLEAGKNLFVPSVTVAKQQALKHALRERFGGDFVKEQCHFVSAAENAALAERGVVNGLWDNYRLVSISPKISSGVSFDEEHFDKAYVFACSILDVRTIKQMLGRVRKLRDNQVFHVLPPEPRKSPEMKRLPTTYRAVKKYHEDKVNVALQVFGEYFAGQFYDPLEKRYEFGSEFLEELVYHALVEKHKELNDFDGEYLRHFLGDCNHVREDIEEELYAQEMYFPTAVNAGITDLVKAEIKDDKVGRDVEALRATINSIYEKHGTAHAQLEKLYREEADAKTEAENLRKRALFITLRIDPLALQSQGEEILRDLVEKKLELPKLQNFEDCFQRKEAILSDPELLEKQFSLVSNVVLCERGYHVWFVTQKMILGLLRIVQGGLGMSFPSLATAFAQNNGPEWVYNPYRRLAEAEVDWLRTHQQTLVACCYGISQNQFDKQTLYGNRKPMQYLLKSEGGIDEAPVNAKNPFHEDAVVKAVVPFRILHKLLQHNFGFGLIKSKPVLVRYKTEDESKLLRTHYPIHSVEEYRQKTGLSGGSQYLRLYTTQLDSRAIRSYCALSKRLTKDALTQYHSKGASKRVEKAAAKLLKKRKHEQTLFQTESIEVVL